MTFRTQVVDAKRIVVKVGSSSISGENELQLDLLVSALAKLHEQGKEVILVTSGAIATALPLFELDARPDDLPTAQAMAAVGQSRLIARYQSSLERFGIIAGQVLLTAADLEQQDTSENARRAIEKLLQLRVLPIVNENDTTATAEIRFGDNDKLAALVSRLAHAELLVLLSDVDSLYTSNPSNPAARRIETVSFDDDLSSVEIGGTGSSVGTGGAQTKVQAAKLAGAAGIPVILTKTALVEAALNGGDVGTFFESK